MSIQHSLKHAISVLKQSARFRVMFAAVLSAVTWFAWAYWANHEDPHHALVSGLSQGGVSFITTSIGSFLLEILYKKIGRSASGRVLTAAIVSAMSLCFMATVHTLAATPNPVLTILPVFSVVVLYCGSYVYGLQKIQNQNRMNAVEVLSS